MISYVIRRTLLCLPVLWGVLTATFLGFHLIAGDPVSVILGNKGSAQDKIRLRRELGLDQSLLVQYWNFLKGAVHFDFGTSYASRQPVWHEIVQSIPYTVELALAAFLIGASVGLVAGSISGIYSHNGFGFGLTLGSVVGISIPTYVLGTVLALVFGVELHWLPVAGVGDARNLVLPAITLAVPLAAVTTRLVRTSMLQVLGMDYIRTARAKGVRYPAIVFKHMLRNAMVPVVTILGLVLANLLGGAIIVENVFNWPGLGTLAVTAAANRDYPVITGTVFFFAVVLVLVNLLVDILYGFIDPQIHYS